jgi:hypothetical protein
MRQLGEKKRQKSQSNFAKNRLEDVETSLLRRSQLEVVHNAELNNDITDQ